MAQEQVFKFISNQKLACILQFASCICWVTSFIYPNEHKMHAMETCLSRCIAGILGNLVLVKYFNGSIAIKNSRQHLYALIRCFTNSFQGLLTSWLMFYLAMPVIHTITSTSTIFTATIQHYCFGILLSKRARVLVFICVFGVMLQANGQFIWQALWGIEDGGRKQSQFQNYQNISIKTSIYLSFMFLCYVVAFSYGLVVIKQVKIKFYQLNLLNNIVHMIVTGFLYFLVQEQKKSSISVLCWSLPYSGFLVFIAQLFFVSSLMLSNSVALMMVLNSSNILFALMYSVFKYKQKLDPLSFVGMVVSVACIFMVLKQKRVDKNVKQNQHKQIDQS